MDTDQCKQIRTYGQRLLIAKHFWSLLILPQLGMRPICGINSLTLNLQISMSARFLRVTNVTLTPCVLTRKDLIFVAAHEGTEEMAESALVRPKLSIGFICFTVDCKQSLLENISRCSVQCVSFYKTILISHFFQIPMNAQVLKQTSATRTPYVPTLKDRTSVAVRGGIVGMVKIAQVKYHCEVVLHTILDPIFPSFLVLISSQTVFIYNLPNQMLTKCKSK